VPTTTTLDTIMTEYDDDDDDDDDHAVESTDSNQPFGESHG